MFEADTANHSGEQFEDSFTEQETVTDQVDTQNDEQTSPPQEEPKGIKVKYNKEERFIAEDEVPTYVQKGLNYDKVAERAKEAEQFQQNLDRIAKFYGFNTHNEYLSALEQAEQERKIQEEAEKLGVPEEVIREHLQPLNQKLSEYEKKLQAIQEQENLRKVEAEIEQLSSKYSDFGKYKDQIFDLAITRGYSLEDAYKLASYEDRFNAAKLEAQQEAVRNLQQNAETSTGSLGSDSPQQADGYIGMTAAERRAFREQNRRR